MGSLVAKLERLRSRLKGDWRESDHPRDEAGRFGSGGSSSGGGSEATATLEKPAAPGGYQDETQGREDEKQGWKKVEDHERWGHDHFDAWAEQLSDQEKQAVNSYKKDSSPHNNHLRLRERISEKGTNEIKEITRALSKASVPHNVVAYRGASSEFYEHLDEGEVFKDDGFVSTTVNRKTADTFSDIHDTGDPGIVMTILVPKGYPAAYVDAFKNAFGDELLLQRGGRFRVLKKKNNRLLLVALPRRVKKKKWMPINLSRATQVGSPGHPSISEKSEKNRSQVGQRQAKTPSRHLLTQLRQLRARLKGDWRESDHPRDEAGRFGEGGGGGGGGGGNGGSAAASSPRQQHRERVQAAKRRYEEAKVAVHAHAKKAEHLEDSLVDLYWEHPAVEKVRDILFDLQSDTFNIQSGIRPDTHSTHDKDVNYRQGEFKKLDKAATKALRLYSYAEIPAGQLSEDIERDRGKVLQALRKCQLFAREGIKAVDAVRQSGRALRDSMDEAAKQLKGRLGALKQQLASGEPNGLG